MPNRDPLGNLVGGGPSRVTTSAAMRARDVARPTEAELAEAAAELVIRHAAPRADTRPLPHGVAPAALPDERLRERRPAAGRSRTRSKPRPGPPPG